MSSIVFLCALCFGTTVEAFQTITHSDHLDVMHEPVYILIIAGIDLLVWCVVFKWIGGYTFHQRTALETTWLKNHPHYPCTNSHELEETNPLDDREKQCRDNHKECNCDCKCEECQGIKYTETLKIINDNKKSIVPFTLDQISSGQRSFFYDPRHDSFNLLRDLVPCFILMCNCLIVYLIDQRECPNVPKYVDPIMALLTIGFLIVSSASMTKKASLILLQGFPEEMENVEMLCSELKSSFSKHIISIHEAHVWCLVPNETYATMHIIFKDEHSYVSKISDIKIFLSTYGINNATIQPEFESDTNVVLGPQNSSLYTRNIASTSSTIEEKDSGDIYIKSVNRGNQRNGLNNRWLKNACLLPCPDTTCLKQRCCIPKDVKETDARMIEEM